MFSSTIGNLEHDTYLLLRQTDQFLEKLVNRVCRMHGITVPGLDVLYIVMAGPKPMSAYRLANIVGREHHSVVEIINRLKKKGLITRSTIDGKPTLQVTEAGATLAATVLATPTVIPAFERLGKRSVEKLRDALMPLRARAAHDLGLLDMGEIAFTPVEDLVGNRKKKKGRGGK